MKHDRTQCEDCGSPIAYGRILCDDCRIAYAIITSNAEELITGYDNDYYIPFCTDTANHPARNEWPFND